MVGDCGGGAGPGGRGKGVGGARLGAAVRHILSPTSAHPHTLTLWAQVRGKQVTYPGG
jgi:hypothetical protein